MIYGNRRILNIKAVTLLAVFSLVIAFSGRVFSQDAATESPALQETAPAAAVQAIDAAPAQQNAVTLDPVAIASKTLALYKDINSYSVNFNLIQPAQPEKLKKMDKDREDQLRNEYLYIYHDRDPQTEGYYIRLEAIRGNNQNTYVIHAPGKDNKYEYLIYKPAGKVVLDEEDPRVTDIPDLRLLDFAENMVFSVGSPKNEVTVNQIPESNQYYIEVVEPERKVTYIVDSVSYHLLKEEILVNRKKTYLFKRSLEWSDFKTDPGYTTDQIIAPPEFNNIEAKEGE
ncbi:MAG TPA: hypothetical protein PLN69_09205 [bacterium]|nr:hypothetical protein [bacterium]